MEPVLVPCLFGQTGYLGPQQYPEPIKIYAAVWIDLAPKQTKLVISEKKKHHVA